MKTLGERLREARDAAGWSQGKLAEVAGVSQGTIGNIEAGIRKRPRDILALAAALKVNATWLESGRGAMRPPTVAQIGVAKEIDNALPLAAIVRPALDQALPVVLDAMARCTRRDELRGLMGLIIDADSPLYRQGLAELLAPQPPSFKPPPLPSAPAAPAVAAPRTKSPRGA